VTTVRIAHAEPRPGRMPDGRILIGQFLIVLADNAGRALPLWLQVPGGDALWRLLERPAADPVMTGVLEETAARLLDAAGVTVTAVDLQVTRPDAVELRSADVAARVGLGTAGGTRHVMLSAGYGLALAAASGAPVRVADAVMDRLAVPVQDEDLLTPFIPAAAAQRLARRARWRFEPRNLAFTDGLDRWELHGSFLGDAGNSHRQDYCCRPGDAGSRTVTLASAVAEPYGFAILEQAVFADDYRGHTITFGGELRTDDVTGHAGLHLAVGRSDEPPGAHLYNRGTGSLTAPGSSGWTRHEVTAQVPGDAEVIRFGLSLTGRGRVDLRDADLRDAGLAPGA
jgi:hypothetical protein